MEEWLKSSRAGSGVSRDRSIIDIFKDMIENIQEIVRCEIRLAKADVKLEAGRRWPPIRLLLAGAVVGLFGVGYLLSSAVYALALIMPPWAASAFVGVVLAIVAGAMINAGLGHWRQLSPEPGNVNGTTKEDVAWSKHQAT
jgi:hypothetical protein